MEVVGRSDVIGAVSTLCPAGMSAADRTTVGKNAGRNWVPGRYFILMAGEQGLTNLPPRAPPVLCASSSN